MAATGLSADPEEYRRRLTEQSDEQIDAWASEIMRDVAKRRGVKRVVDDVVRAGRLDDRGFERTFASGGGAPATVGRSGRAAARFAPAAARMRTLPVFSCASMLDRFRISICTVLASSAFAAGAAPR